MNIAFFHELPDGGARNATLKMASLLKTLGHNVDLYYVAEKKDKIDSDNLNNVFFYEFKPKAWRGNNWAIRIYKDTLELVNLYKLDRKIANDINFKKYDMVVVNASQFIEAPFILRFIKTSKIFYAHDPNYRIIYEKLLDVPQSLGFIKYSYEKLNRFFRKIFDISNISKADLILANSKFAKDTIFKTYNLKSTVSYLGVDPDIFKPQDLDKEIDILFVGSHDPIDGFQLLSDAVKIVDRKLNIASVPGKNNMTLSLGQMAVLYQKSKIVVCLAVNEPFGLVPLEAMSCKVPVIAVNEGGYIETVTNDKTGFLIKRDQKELAKKIKLLLDSPKLALRLGENGRNEVLTNWTWEKKCRGLEKILLKVYGNINNNR